LYLKEHVDALESNAGAKRLPSNFKLIPDISTYQTLEIEVAIPTQAADTYYVVGSIVVPALSAPAQSRLVWAVKARTTTGFVLCVTNVDPLVTIEDARFEYIIFGF
jgi:hypothetical protein